MTTTPLTTITEFDRNWQAARLSRHDVEALQAASIRWKDDLELPGLPFEIDWEGPDTKLRSQYVTGFVRVGQLQIEIRPKFLTPDVPGESDRWRLALWNALRIARADVQVASPVMGRESKRVSFVDLLAESFLESFQRGSARGLPRQYHEKRISSRSLRGSLDMSRPVEMLLKPGFIPCRVSVLSESTPLNQLFRWSARKLAELAVAPRRARSLLDVHDSLSHVPASAPSHVRVDRTSLGPQHVALGPAREIGLLLLKGHTRNPEPEAGGVHGILWVTHLLFEDVIRALAARAAASVGLRVVKKPMEVGRSTGTGSPLRTTPDVTVYRSHDVVLILDAKYKIYTRSPKSPDIYQVVTAGKVADCDEVGLVYPSHEADQQTWELIGAGKPHHLSAISVDLLSLAEDSRGAAVTEELARFLAEHTTSAA